MLYFSDNNKTINSSSGWSLDNWQVRLIIADAVGNRIADVEIKSYLKDSGWCDKHIAEFMQFINSEAIFEMDFE